MTSEPATLLAVGRVATWPDSRGTLRRVGGPVLPIAPGETLTWFDPLDRRGQVVSDIEPGVLSTFATALEWPDDPGGLSGAAVCLGDAEAVVAWDDACEFGTDRGVGCVVVSGRMPEVSEQLGDIPHLMSVLAAVEQSTVHPLDIDGDVVGLAFHCGMGASTNYVFTGRDHAGGVVALLADLELLAGSALLPESKDS